MAKIYHQLGHDTLVIDTDRQAWAYKESMDELFWTWHIYEQMSQYDDHIIFTHADGSIIGFNLNATISS